MVYLGQVGVCLIDQCHILKTMFGLFTESLSMPCKHKIYDLEHQTVHSFIKDAFV